MSQVQTFTVLVLWAVMLALMGLVLILYRQVDRAYRLAGEFKSSGLLPGVEIPPVEILTERGIEPFPIPDGEQLSLLGFINSSCGDCRDLVTRLARGTIKVPLPLVMLVIEGPGFPQLEESLPEQVRIHSLAHLGDARHEFGVTSVPLIYALHGRVVLAASAASSQSEMDELLMEAEANLSRLEAVPLEKGATEDNVVASPGSRLT